MSFRAEVLRVLIASPSDVYIERDEVERAIFEWNKTYAEEMQIVLLPSRWESDVVPTYSKNEPQEIINEQLVSKCDILIGVFWTKLGTPTKKHSSGTLEEVELFIDRGKDVMIYFVDRDIPRGSDFDEVKKVDEYRDYYGKKGVYGKYNIDSIVKHLYKKAIEHKKAIIIEDENPQESHAQHTEPSPTVDEIILNGKLTKQDLLLLQFILDTGIIRFGARWMAEESKRKIQGWESKNMMFNELSSKYEEVISSMHGRGLLEPTEYTRYSNVRLYSMTTAIHDQLRLLSEDSLKLIKSVKQEFEIPY